MNKKWIALSLALLVAITFVLSNTDQTFSKKTFAKVEETVKGYLVKTPLIALPSLSAKTGKRVFIKDESKQKGGSFKTRGVTYEVFKTVEEVIEKDPALLKQGLQIVTQTDGNHGVALILATTSAIEKYSKLHPALEKEIRCIEPVIFTYKNVLPLKRVAMDEAMAQYRKVSQDPKRGSIFDSYNDYGDAKGGREKFISESKGRALYMEHGGMKTMQGYALAAHEILEQLKENGVEETQKVCLLLPIGAGGPIGIAAALKAYQPHSTAIMVQTPRWGAFVRSFNSGKMEYNDSSLSPFTVEVEENGRMKSLVYEDGISVDSPESNTAIKMAQKYLDDAVLADAKRALLEVAPLLLTDLDLYYKDPSQSIVGGTTAILGDALLAHRECEAIKKADVIVLFGTEGNIDSSVANYTRELQRKL